MTRFHLYKYAALFLLILNIGMIVFFLLTKPPAPMPLEAPDQLIDVLELDEGQLDEFHKLVEVHSTEMMDLNEDQKALLEDYFNQIQSKTSVEKSDQLLNAIQNLERQKLNITYLHFEDVKSLLNQEQKKNFPQFMERAIQRILGGPGNMPPPHHRNEFHKLNKLKPNK